MTTKRNGKYTCFCCGARGKTFCDDCKKLVRRGRAGNRRGAPC